MKAAEFLDVLQHLTASERAELDRLLSQGTPRWVPQAQQIVALENPADIIFYGGQAGGGKSDLLMGNALTRQERSIIFRREAVQLVGLEERMTTILGSRDGYNSQDAIWRLPEGRTLEFGSVKQPDDWMKYQGRPHDFKGFDEITHFLESQFRALIGWMRTDNPMVRQRVICAGNPPTSSDGEWVIQFWGPWLDPMHANPAKPGELRWFVMDEDGHDMEVPGPAPVKVKGRMVKPKSRTFIPSSVSDNLFLMQTGYLDTLMSMPEPLRSMMAEGNFQAGRTDDVWQLIPTDWIRKAQARWVPLDAKPPMTEVGYDVARGGTDSSVVARRHTTWVDELSSVPGVITKDGPSGAGVVVPLIRDRALVCVDAIGVGAAVFDFLGGLGTPVMPVVASEGSKATSKDGNFRFKNLRAEMYWRLREALDPTNPDPLALPPDKELFQELAAHRYKVVQMGQGKAGIQVLDKDDIRKDIGRSPDRADAVALTFTDAAKTWSRNSVDTQSWQDDSSDWRLM